MTRTRLKAWVTAMMVIGLCGDLSGSPAQAQELTASNTSRYVCKGRWDWRVFVQASPGVLGEIRFVEYTLHPTFPNPVRRVEKLGDPRYPFGLFSNGWGVFEIAVKVTFKDNRTRLLKHMLNFSAPPVERSLPITADNTSRRVREDWWDWEVFIQGPEEALQQVQCVEYTLHPTFPRPVREMVDRGQGAHAFPFSASGWGTFKIPIRVFLKNGQVQELIHQLHFR